MRAMYIDIDPDTKIEPFNAFEHTDHSAGIGLRFTKDGKEEDYVRFLAFDLDTKLDLADKFHILSEFFRSAGARQLDREQNKRDQEQERYEAMQRGEITAQEYLDGEIAAA